MDVDKFVDQTDSEANPSTGCSKKKPDLNERLKKNVQHVMDWEPDSWSRAIQMDSEKSVRVTVFKS